MFPKKIAAIGGVFLLVLLGLVVWWVQNRASTEPPEVANGPIYTLRLGHNIPIDSALHQAALRLATLVAERSQQQVRIEIFPAQQLGTDDKMLEMARTGELDIVLTPTAKVSSSVPAMQYADLPFYFPSREDLYGMLDGEPGQMLLQRLQSIDLVGVTFWENGFKHFTANKPLHVPTDFQGLNIRTMKSRLLMEQFKNLGANPIQIDFHATRQALADKVVDGQENPLVAIVSMGLHEVQKHLTLSSHGYMGYVFMVSARTFNNLPPQWQQLLVDTAKELTPWERQETHRREAALLETIRRAGVTVHEPSHAEREKFKAVMANIPALFEEVIGSDIMSRTEEILDRKYGPAQRIVVGLDADLSQYATMAALGFRRGAHLAIEEINATGGVLGRPLQLVARDNKGVPSLGVSNINAFASRSDVVAVLGGVQSAVVMAQKEAVATTGLPFLVAWASVGDLFTPDQAPGPVFRLSADDRLAAPFIINHLLQQGYRRPVILLENTVWGRVNLERMQEHLKRAGHDFLQVESFNRGQADFNDTLRRLERSGADVLVMVATGIEGGLVVRTLAEHASALPVISHWGISSGNFWATNRDALAKVNMRFFQTFTFLGNSRLQSQQLAQKYQQRYGVASLREVTAPQAVAQAYDLVHLLAHAIAQAGSTDRAAVRQALERLPPMEGAVRRYAPAFTATRHDALGSENYHMVRFAADGAIVVVSP